MLLFLFFLFFAFIVYNLGIMNINAYFKIFITNVNGLNSLLLKNPCIRIFTPSNLSPVPLIQETHLKQSDVARFQNKYYKLIAFSCAQNKLRGCLSLLTGS